MAETLVQYQNPIAAPDGKRYEASTCGAPMDGGPQWHGWVEFVPVNGGEAIRTSRDTTQPKRADIEYWATGLTPVYLQGALARALDARSPRAHRSR